MPEYELWDIHLFFLVKHYWNAFAIVPHFNQVLRRINSYFDHTHLLISVQVICRVNQNLI